MVIISGILRDFSEQQVINCNPKFGCKGGFWTRVWREIKKGGYIALEKDQPYLALKEATCSRTTPNGLEGLLAIDKYQVLRKKNREETMLGFLARDGPVTVAIRANDTLYYYGSGVIDYCMGGKGGLTHLVILVGYDQQVLIMKNSWGTDWGEKGFFRVARGCGSLKKGYSFWASSLSVVSHTTYTTVEYGDEFFEFTETTPQKISKDMTGVGVQIGDLITLKILGTVDPAVNSFTVDLLFVDGKKVSRVYRLQYMYLKSQDNWRMMCRQLASHSKPKQKGCPVSSGTIIKILVSDEGYSVHFDAIALQLYPHQLQVNQVNKIEVKSSKKVFEYFKLTRRID